VEAATEVSAGAEATAVVLAVMLVALAEVQHQDAQEVQSHLIGLEDQLLFHQESKVTLLRSSCFSFLCLL
jgi:hypothetical protein